jgi:fibronectin type 3 domain-containing protein
VNIAQQVWVDSNGYLHLKLSTASGSWKDVEIVSRDVTGYGTYTWVTDGVKNIDKNIVLGLFPYLDDSHEVDQEISRWGDANSPNFAYTVQPDPVQAGVTQKVFELPTTTLATTFTTTWTPTKISFTTIEGNTTVGSFTSNVARDATGVHALTNLWQFSGAPSDGKPIEVVFKDFQFTSYNTPAPAPAPSSVSGAPTSLSVSQPLGKSTLTWAAPASNGGSQITSYKVFRGTTSNTAGQVQISSSATTSYDDTQVTAGQTYYYSVKAVNAVGDSVASNVVSVLVKALPGTPIGLTTHISDRALVLSWSAPTSNGYTPITGYKVYRSGASGTEAYLTTVTGTTFTDSSLVNGNVYYYRISAVNAMGEGAQCAEVHDSPATTPAAPTITAVSTNDSVLLSWSAPNNGGRQITGYVVYRGATAAFTAATILASSVAENTYNDSTVAVGSTYYYFVTATSSIGTSSPSSSGSVSISEQPSAPRLVTPTIASDHVQLSWSAPASSGSTPVSGYYVYRSLTSGSGTVIAHLGNVLAYSDASVTLGQTYYYSVSAENQDGAGPLSAEVQTTYVLTPNAPTNLMVVGSVGTADLSWSAPEQNGAAISGYAIRMWTSDGTPSVVAQIGPSPTSMTLRDLTDGVQYWFSVAAANSAGEGASSISATCTIGSAPSAPAALGTAAGNGLISISWGEPVSNGGLVALTYHVWRSTTGASSLIADLDASILSYTDTSVVPGTTYYYTVTASNNLGVSEEAGPSCAVAAILPEKPLSVTVTTDSSSALVSWTIPASDGGISLTGFKVYRSTGADWTLIDTLNDPATLSYRDLAAVGGIAYQYCIAATNALGEGPKSDPTTSIVSLSAPSQFNLTATVGNSNVTLNWGIPTSNGTPLLRFVITRTESASGAITSTTVGSSYARYVDTTVLPGLNYTYKVTAYNAIGSTSADAVTVRVLRTEMLKVQIVPFQRSISVSGTVTDVSGHGISGQKVIIYRSSSTTGIWIIAVQLTTSSNGKYSTILANSAGITGLRVMLPDDGTHVPITIDRTIGSLKLKNGNLASIMTSSTMSDSSLSSTNNRITFTLEQAGSTNISIPKDAVMNPALIGVSIDGKQGNYQINETDDQYVFSLGNVKAGQIITMSLGQPTTQDTVPILIGISLFLSVCVGTMVFWRTRRK